MNITVKKIMEHVESVLEKRSRKSARSVNNKTYRPKLRKYWVVIGKEVNMDKAYFWSGMVFHTRRAAQRRLKTLDKLTGKKGAAIGTFVTDKIYSEDDVLRIDGCTVASRLVDYLVEWLGCDTSVQPVGTAGEPQHTEKRGCSVLGVIAMDKDGRCLWSGYPTNSRDDARWCYNELLCGESEYYPVANVYAYVDGVDLWEDGKNVEKDAWIKEGGEEK